MKPMNWISPTGLRPCAAMPTHRPLISSSDERRVDHALRPEALLQPDGGAEHAAVDADVLAEHDDVRVLLHGARERQVDGFDQRHLRHRTHPSARRAGRRRRAAARRRGDRTWSPARAALVAR